MLTDTQKQGLWDDRERPIDHQTVLDEGKDWKEALLEPYGLLRDPPHYYRFKEYLEDDRK